MIAVGRPGRAETGSLKPSPLIPSAGFRVCLPKIASGLAQMPRWAILSGRPAAEVERREILLEGLIDMGSRALHDRLKPAEPHPDQFPNTGLSIRPFVDHREPLCLVRAQRQNDPSSGFDLIEDRWRQSLGGGRQQGSIVGRDH